VGGPKCRLGGISGVVADGRGVGLGGERGAAEDYQSKWDGAGAAEPDERRGKTGALEEGELRCAVGCLLDDLDDLDAAGPGPETGTRLPVKSSPSCGHRAAWCQRPSTSCP
jgi:hypothetical protein